MTDLLTHPRLDRFNTALDRAVLVAGYPDGASFNAAYDAHQWEQLTPAEKADMSIYWQAVTENHQWDAMRLRHANRTRLAFDIGPRCWGRVEFTDAEKTAERQAFQGKAPLARKASP